MLRANPGRLWNAVANTSFAPGAMSCTISIIAAPSSNEPDGPDCPGTTITSPGRSPLAIRADTIAGPALSDRTPTVTPAPVTPNAFTLLAVWLTYPCDVTAPTFVLAPSASRMNVTSGWP